ncbi:uncharacterized protein LOC118644782 [Monomorium pharaonis]|uniref:uncharacterized protein LOC118644782 n=1 Tax=Monomorium pharaonis TaxID=307658 RepID=UPI001747A23C|nr:uncharacterized protein LOC118644782 [Monomorium pharaonis]
MLALQEYNINKILLSYLDHWPLQNKFVKSFLPISNLVLQMSIFSFELFNENWNYDKTRSLYEAVENYWNIYTNKFKIHKLKNYSIQSQKFIIIYSTIPTYVTTPSILDIMWPPNKLQQLFTISIEWKIDMDKYYIPIIYNTILIMVDIIILIGADSIYIVRACSSFSIVSQKFKTMTSKLDVNMEISKCYRCYINANVSECCINTIFKSASERVIYQEHIICLKKYQIVLEFVQILNSLNRVVTLIWLFIAYTILSLGGIQLAYVLDKSKTVIKIIVTVIDMVLQLMLLCYPGQKLLNESQNVFYQTYAIKWYIFSPRLKSLLIIILHKSFILCGLTDCNMFSILMKTHSAVVQAGISYFMIFLSLKD